VGDSDHDGCAVVLCNGTEKGEKKMEVGKVRICCQFEESLYEQMMQEHSGEVWTDLLGWSKEEIKIDEEGWGTFVSPAGSVRFVGSLQFFFYDIEMLLLSVSGQRKMHKEDRQRG
jgi:alpha-amylase